MGWFFENADDIEKRHQEYEKKHSKFSFEDGKEATVEQIIYEPGYSSGDYSYEQRFYLMVMLDGIRHVMLCYTKNDINIWRRVLVNGTIKVTKLPC